VVAVANLGMLSLISFGLMHLLLVGVKIGGGEKGLVVIMVVMVVVVVAIDCL